MSDASQRPGSAHGSAGGSAGDSGWGTGSGGAGQWQGGWNKWDSWDSWRQPKAARSQGGNPGAWLDTGSQPSGATTPAAAPAAAPEPADDGPLGQLIVGPPEGRVIWQAKMDRNQWQDVNPDWHDQLMEACEEGTPELRLEHRYPNRRGEITISWYRIDLRDHSNITQENEASHVKRKLRVVSEHGLARAPRRVGMDVMELGQGGNANAEGELPPPPPPAAPAAGAPPGGAACQLG